MVKTPNVITEVNGVATVWLNSGFKALVDVGDVPKIRPITWTVDRIRNNLYAKGRIGKKYIRMHRYLMDTPDGLETDHVNRNGLDNRRCNLRVATRSQNAANTLIKRNRKHGAIYKGVHFQINKKTWLAQIIVNKKKIHLGTFRDQLSAANAYWEASKKHFGEFARMSTSTT